MRPSTSPQLKHRATPTVFWAPQFGHYTIPFRGHASWSHAIMRRRSRPAQQEARERPAPKDEPETVEAAGIEPASANAPSVRLYERCSQFSFTLPRELGRRGRASPLSVPYEPRARDRKVILLK